MDDFENHEACGNGGEWIHGPSSDSENDWFMGEEAFHPNVEGQGGYANALNSAIAELYDPIPPSPSFARSLSAKRTTSMPKLDPQAPSWESKKGSIGTLGLQLVKERCSPRRGHAELQLLVEGKGFVPNSKATIQFVAQEPKTLKSVEASEVGSIRSSVTLRPGLDRSRIYGLEMSGHDLGGGERLLVASLRSPKRLQGTC